MMACEYHVPPVHGIAQSFDRKAMKPITFFNGTVIPTRTSLACASRALHFDEQNYDNLHKFNGFRFAEDEEETAVGPL